MAIYSNGTLVVDAANVQAPRLTGTLPALNASSLTNLDAADLSGTLPALNASALTNLDAADLSGDLPAIDGSNLTGVSGSTAHLAVGTSHMLFNKKTSNWFPGDTQAGSMLFYRNDSQSTYSMPVTAAGGSYPTASGTWRNMSCMQSRYYSNQGAACLCTRTA